MMEFNTRNPIIKFCIIVLFVGITISSIVNRPIRPPDSTLELSINNQTTKWTSSGFKTVANEYVIKYILHEESAFFCDYLFIWIKKPIELGIYHQDNCIVEFFVDYSQVPAISRSSFLELQINKYVDQPGGEIEGEIKATMYDNDSNEYVINGIFQAHLADGTIYDIE